MASSASAAKYATCPFAKGAPTGPTTVLHLFDQPLRIARPYEGYTGAMTLPKEVYETAAEYVRRCRAGEGPFVIEALTYRHAGHHVNDPGTYMPEDQKEHYRKMDPCLLGRQFLIELGGASCEEVAAIEADVQQAMDDAVEFARQSPETTIEDFLEQIGGDQ